MRKFSLCILMAVIASTALCQEFEVVSIKPNNSGPDDSDSENDRGRLTASNLSLKKMIVMAYGLKDYQIVGPDWLNSARFDIAAKFPEALSKDPEKYNTALNAMMQKMLADRFKLAVHTDHRSFSVYGLTTAKSGIKFKEALGCESHNSSTKNYHYAGTCVSMRIVADFLSRRSADLPADLPVVDMTGLKGSYNLTLDWVRENKDDAPAADVKSGSPLPEALQEQLGLKLETRKAPIEVLVVDHAERVSTDN